MSKLSQCAKCDHDRRSCGHYTPENDTDCTHYMRGGTCQVKDESTTDVETIVLWAFLYTLFSIYAYIKWFDDARVFYIFAIPLVILIIWAVVAYKAKSRKQRQAEKKKVSEAIDRAAIECMKLPKEANQSEENIEDMEQIDAQLSGSTARTSLMVALREINAQFEFDEDQNFRVSYQGENFRIIAENNSLWIHIQDCWWYEASLDDIDNLALLHRAVNECNMHDLNKMVYTYNKAEKEVWLHTLRDLLWMPQIPESAQYLQSTFNSMLRSHQLFFRVMEDIRREEHSIHY